jgi:hypothetical protein
MPSADDGMIFDVAFHPSLWVTAQEEVAGRAVLLVQERVGEELDKGYKTPKTRNNYKCADPVFLVAPALISGADIAKTKLVAGAFEGDVTVSSKVFAAAAEKAEKEASRRKSSADAAGGSPLARRSSAENIAVSESGSASRRTSTDSTSTAAAASAAVVVPPSARDSVSRHQEHESWKAYLTAGEEIVATQLVVKPNPYGIGHKRQLILTTTPRLIYVDAGKKEVKGEVEWTKGNPPTIYAVNKDTFELVVSKRTYKFVDKTNGAEYWVKQVQDAIKLFG